MRRVEDPNRQGPIQTSALSEVSTGARGFDELYRELQPAVSRYVSRLVGDPDVADDVVQEAFVRLLRRELSGDDARLWVFTVATNLVRDRGRSAARRRRILEAAAPEHPESDHPERDLVRAETIRRVREALDQLPERDRAMLLMREEGFRYSEIAEVVDVAPSSVGTLIARAVRKFTEAYRPDD